MITLFIPTNQTFHLALYCKGQWKLTDYDENLLRITPHKGTQNGKIEIDSMGINDCRSKLELMVNCKSIDMDMEIRPVFVTKDVCKQKKAITNHCVLFIEKINQAKKELLSTIQRYEDTKLTLQKDGNCIYFYDEMEIPVFIAYSEDICKTIYDFMCYLIDKTKSMDEEDRKPYFKTAIDLLNTL